MPLIDPLISITEESKGRIVKGNGPLTIIIGPYELRFTEQSYEEFRKRSRAVFAVGDPHLCDPSAGEPCPSCKKYWRMMISRGWHNGREWIPEEMRR